MHAVDASDTGRHGTVALTTQPLFPLSFLVPSLLKTKKKWPQTVRRGHLPTRKVETRRLVRPDNVVMFIEIALVWGHRIMCLNILM